MNLLIKICLGLLFVFNAYAVDNRFDTMVVLGDSLSDNGNLYRHLLHITPASPPYYQGRFSNGPLWIEYLYNSYFPENHTKGLDDYAVGGAGAVLSQKESLPITLTSELADYLYNHPYGKKDKSLFAIWIGANNYIKEPTNVNELTNGVVKAIGRTIEQLIVNGGNKFVVINLPDLARLPTAKNSTKQWLLTQLTETHNQKLAAKIQVLKQKYPTVTFVYIDIYSFYNETVSRAGNYGFDNTDEPCYLGGYRGLSAQVTPDDDTLHEFLKSQTPTLTEAQWLILNNTPELREAVSASYHYALLPKRIINAPLECSHYLFWDKIHPTTAVHKMIAEKIKNAIDEAGLQAVLPEAFD